MLYEHNTRRVYTCNVSYGNVVCTECRDTYVYPECTPFLGMRCLSHNMSYGTDRIPTYRTLLLRVRCVLHVLSNRSSTVVSTLSLNRVRINTLSRIMHCIGLWFTYPLFALWKSATVWNIADLWVSRNRSILLHEGLLVDVGM
jgi:hypothetical protein